MPASPPLSPIATVSGFCRNMDQENKDDLNITCLPEKRVRSRSRPLDTDDLNISCMPEKRVRSCSRPLAEKPVKRLSLSSKPPVKRLSLSSVKQNDTKAHTPRLVPPMKRLSLSSVKQNDTKAHTPRLLPSFHTSDSDGNTSADVERIEELHSAHLQYIEGSYATEYERKLTKAQKQIKKANAERQQAQRRADGERAKAAIAEEQLKLLQERLALEQEKNQFAREKNQFAHEERLAMQNASQENIAVSPPRRGRASQNSTPKSTPRARSAACARSAAGDNTEFWKLCVTPSPYPDCEEPEAVVDGVPEERPGLVGRGVPEERRGLVGRTFNTGVHAATCVFAACSVGYNMWRTGSGSTGSGSGQHGTSSARSRSAGPNMNDSIEVKREVAKNFTLDDSELLSTSKVAKNFTLDDSDLLATSISGGPRKN